MELKKKKIFLIGGAGFIGSHVLDILLEHDNEVTIFDDFSSGKLENIEHNLNDEKLKIIKGDIRDLYFLSESMKDHNIVINMATVCLRISINNPFVVESVNSLGALNVCQASLVNKVERLIYISSSEALGSAKYFPMDEGHPCNPTTVYGATKLTGEAITRAYYFTYKLPVIIIRPFNSYGPRSHMVGSNAEIIPRMIIRLKCNKNPIIYGDGEQTRDFTYVTETAKGIFLSSQSDDLVGKIINIAYGERISINRIAKILLKHLNKGNLIIEYPLPNGRPGDVRDHYADISKAKSILGFNPQINIEEGIQIFLNWLENKNFDLESMLLDAGEPNW